MNAIIIYYHSCFLWRHSFIETSLANSWAICKVPSSSLDSSWLTSTIYLQFLQVPGSEKPLPYKGCWVGPRTLKHSPSEACCRPPSAGFGSGRGTGTFLGLVWLWGGFWPNWGGPDGLGGPGWPQGGGLEGNGGLTELVCLMCPDSTFHPSWPSLPIHLFWVSTPFHPVWIFLQHLRNESSSWKAVLYCRVRSQLSVRKP